MIEVKRLTKPQPGRGPIPPILAEDWDECIRWMGAETAMEAEYVVWGEDLARIPLVGIRYEQSQPIVTWCEPSLTTDSVQDYKKAADLCIGAVERDAS